MSSEEERQTAKEEAVLLALKHDRALIRRDLEILKYGGEVQHSDGDRS